MERRYYAICSYFRNRKDQMVKLMQQDLLQKRESYMQSTKLDWKKFVRLLWTSSALWCMNMKNLKQSREMSQAVLVVKMKSNTNLLLTQLSMWGNKGPKVIATIWWWLVSFQNIIRCNAANIIKEAEKNDIIAFVPKFSLKILLNTTSYNNFSGIYKDLLALEVLHWQCFFRFKKFRSLLLKLECFIISLIIWNYQKEIYLLFLWPVTVVALQKIWKRRPLEDDRKWIEEPLYQDATQYIL